MANLWAEDEAAVILTAEFLRSAPVLVPTRPELACTVGEWINLAVLTFPWTRHTFGTQAVSGCGLVRFLRLVRRWWLRAAATCVPVEGR